MHRAAAAAEIVSCHQVSGKQRIQSPLGQRILSDKSLDRIRSLRHEPEIEIAWDRQKRRDIRKDVWDEMSVSTRTVISTQFALHCLLSSYDSPDSAILTAALSNKRASVTVRSFSNSGALAQT